MNERIKNTLQSIMSYYWKPNPVEFTYPKFIRTFKKVLIIIPRQEQTNENIADWCEKIIFALGKKQINILSIGTPVEEFREWSSQIIYFTDTDINFIGLVSSRVIQTIQKQRFKLVVDLSPDFDFITAQIGLRAKIATRIGLSSTQYLDIAKRYFNLVVCGNFSQNYEPLINMLFAGGR